MTFPQWHLLWQRYLQHCLPHALLFIGAPGTGKQQFAITFAKSILCRQPTHEGNSCGECPSCRLMQAKTHPDLVYIEPEQAGHMIKIDQIRQMIHFANETPQQGGFKIIIIHPATAMNLYAANALLKILEEPAPNTLFILISDHSLRLPPTIISRCQKIVFQKPIRTLENDKLRNDFYQGLNALSQKQIDPLQLAMQWQEHDTRMLLIFFLSWLHDLLKIHSHYHLLKYIDHVQKIYSHLLNSLNLNRQLVLEELFIKWTRYVSR